MLIQQRMHSGQLYEPSNRCEVLGNTPHLVYLCRFHVVSLVPPHKTGTVSRHDP